jgi:hypothetical protein
MSKVGLSGLLLAAIGLLGCNTTRGGGGENDGQSHWLRACQSSAECGDAQCVCGLCSRGCGASSEGRSRDADLLAFGLCAGRRRAVRVRSGAARCRCWIEHAAAGWRE